MNIEKLPKEAGRTLLQLLVGRAGPEGTNIKQLAEWTGLSSAAVHRHLQELVVQGMAVREGRGPKVRYRAVPYFAALWVDPERGIMDSWNTNDPVDWRFPLVTRVPDEPAHAILVRFLRDLVRALKDQPFSVLVYGSCAEGNARDKSDLDILLMREDPAQDGEVRDLVDEANLWAKRPLDLRIIGDFQELPEGISRNVREHGKTVYTNRHEGSVHLEY